MRSDQLGILQEMITFIQKSRILYWDADIMSIVERFNPFQKGIIISTRSLINLYHQLQKDFNFEYLLTRRLNQDPVEHMFGVIRQMGGTYDHPNALSFKYRIMRYILGKRTALTASMPNTTCADPCVKLTEKSKNTLKLYREFSSPIIKTNLKNLISTLNLEVSTEHATALADNMSVTGNALHDIVNDELMDDHTDEVYHLPECEQEGFSYVLGYIARKFPHLADEVEAPKDDWISTISKGYLKHMKQEFVPEFELFEYVFRQCHGDFIKPGKNVLAHLVMVARRRSQISEDVIKFYMQCRLFFQIRHLNRQLKITSNANSIRKLAKLVK